MNVMTRRGSLDNIVTYEHVCDTAADLLNIPIQRSTLGSTAIVLKGESGGVEVYIANSNGEWMLISMCDVEGGGTISDGGVDTSNDTVTVQTLLQGITAHDSTGQEIIGSIIRRTINDLQEVDNNLVIPAGFYNEEVSYILPEVPEQLPVAEENDVIFIDYDGTIRYSYSKEEFLSLTQLPPNPVHDGLIAQGWNWSLTNAQNIIQQRSALAIGQNYITNDNKTRIYINIPEDELTIKLCFTLNGSAQIEWGDNTYGQLNTNSLSNVQTQHTYNTKGTYILSITINKMGMIVGTSSACNLIANPNSTGTFSQYFFISLIQKVELGKNMAIGTRAFTSCDNLQSITMPLTSLYNKDLSLSSFEECIKLKAVILPPNLRSINPRAFQKATSLKYVAFPFSSTYTSGTQTFSGCASLRGQYLYFATLIIQNKCFYTDHLQYFEFYPELQKIGPSAFYQAQWLRQITFPSTLQFIEKTAFYNAAVLSEIHFQSSAPPQLEESLIFWNLPADCKIYVPVGTLQAYTTATNYPDPSVYTYLEE